MKSGTAIVNQTSLYYEVMGEGSWLVLISGGGLLDRRGWDNQFESFAKYHRVIRYDIRGIGKSARPLNAFSHSEDLYALLKLLDVEKAHIAGLSFGGSIAIDFALDHPEMVDRLILAATGPSTEAKGEANLKGLAALSAIAKKEGLARAIQLVVDTNTFISQENSAGRGKIRDIYVDNGDVFESEFPLVALWEPTEPPASGRLSEIGARTLVIVAGNDNAAYKAVTENVAASISGAKKVVIDGAAHAIHLDKPEEFNQAVLEFLSERGS